MSFGVIGKSNRALPLFLALPRNHLMTFDALVTGIRPNQRIAAASPLVSQGAQGRALGSLLTLSGCCWPSDSVSIPSVRGLGWTLRIGSSRGAPTAGSRQHREGLITQSHKKGSRAPLTVPRPASETSHPCTQPPKHRHFP